MTTETTGTPIGTDLLEALKRGDGGAWTELIQRWTSALQWYAKKILDNHHDAEDVVSVAWVSCRQAIIGSELPILYLAYFKTAVRNQAVRLLKRKGRLPTVSLDRSLDGNPDGNPLENTLVDGKTRHCSPENRELVERAMDVLDELQRAVIVCRVIDGMTQEQTAEHLGLRKERGTNKGEPSIDKVRTTEENALKKMRNAIAHEIGRGAI